jgi:hypothetical protein
MPEQLFSVRHYSRTLFILPQSIAPRSLENCYRRQATSHLPLNHLTQQTRMKLRKKMTTHGDKTSHHFSVVRSSTLIC